MLFLSATALRVHETSTHHMEIVPAFARYCRNKVSNVFVDLAKELTQAAIISWVFARRTCAIEMYLADTTNIVIRNIPSPCSYRVPFDNLDLHFGVADLANVQAVDPVVSSASGAPRARLGAKMLLLQEFAVMVFTYLSRQYLSRARSLSAPTSSAANTRFPGPTPLFQRKPFLCHTSINLESSQIFFLE